MVDKFGEKGFSIVGVTGESASVVKAFMKKKTMNYLIALGGAPEYRTRGIPRGWLISAAGKVVWEGHPSSLQDSKIEEELKHVILGPPIKLPGKLAAVKRVLNAGQYAASIKALEKLGKKAKEDSVKADAEKAIEGIETWGKAQLAEVEKKVEAGEFHVVLKQLNKLEKGFKGHDVGDAAKDRLRALKKDKELKQEIEIATAVVKAEAYMNVGAYKKAAGGLKKYTKERYADAKMQAVAVELFDECLSKL